VRSLVAYTYRAVISIEVTLQQLAQTLTRYGFAYFVTAAQPVIERTQRGYVPPSMLKTWLVT
jgi:hypothetical protein